LDEVAYIHSNGQQTCQAKSKAGSAKSSYRFRSGEESLPSCTKMKFAETFEILAGLNLLEEMGISAGEQ